MSPRIPCKDGSERDCFDGKGSWHRKSMSPTDVRSVKKKYNKRYRKHGKNYTQEVAAQV